MTITTQSSRTVLTGNGVTTAFDFTFKVLSASDLVVSVWTNNIETVKTITTHYTVSLLTEGGTVTFLTAPASGTTVVIERDMAFTQPTDYENQGSFYPATHGRSFDRATMLVQQLKDSIDRSAQLPSSAPVGFDPELPYPTANGYLAINSAGDGWTFVPVAPEYTASIATITSYGAIAGDTGDQSADIQSAIDNETVVYIPEGTYRYATTLEIPAGVTLYGPGKLHYTGTDNAIELLGDDITLREFTLYSDNAATYDSGHRGVFGQLTTFSPLTVGWFDNIKIREVTIYGFGDTGVRIDWIRDSSIDHNVIRNCAYGGIILLSPHNVSADDNDIYDITPGTGGTGYGISFSRASSATISGVPDTAISTTNAPEPLFSSINDNRINNIPDFVAIDLHSGRGITINGNKTHDVQVSINLEHATSGAEVAGIADITITGNTLNGITSSKSPGILIDAQSGAGEISYGITITGNSILEHGLSTGSAFEGANGGAIYARDVDGLTIVGNTFDTCYGRAISLDEGVRSCTIGHNAFVRLQSENSTQTAIELISDSARAIVSSNHMHSSAGMLFECVAPASTYGIWLDNNRVSNGATLSDTTSLARAKRIKIIGSATYDPPNMGDGARAEVDVSCPGAILGDYAMASFSLSTQGIALDPQVTVADSVKVGLQNETGGAINLASGTMTVMVVRDSA